MRFEGKTALVTGASEGIGFAIAEGLAAGGARVVLMARREDVLARAVDQLGHRTSYVVGDVADDQALQRAVGHAAEFDGGIDLLVSNAGTLIPGAIDQQPMDQVDAMLAVNLRGTIALVHGAVPVLRDGAATLLVSSCVSRQTIARLGIYSATKVALNHLVPIWATELAPRGIRVNAICPGGTDTPALRGAEQFIPGLAENTVDCSLVKRIAGPEEIAQPALTLLDNAVGGFVTGSVWDVDGGYLRDKRTLWDM